MTRYTYGGEVTLLSVKEAGGVVGAGLVLDRGPAAFPLFAVDGSGVSSFFLWDGSGYNTAVSSVSVDSNAFLPRFQVDNITELRDAAGRSLLPYERGGSGGTALTSYASQVATLSDYPTAFPPASHTHSAYLLATGGDAAATPDTVVRRTAGGQVKVADPAEDDDAVSRAALATALSGLTFNYNETMASAPAGSMFARICTNGAWPSRGSTRTDIVVAWIAVLATDPAPPIGGTGAAGNDYWQKVDA